MPTGVYKRTEEHKRICSLAGKASNKSKLNVERYAKRWEYRNCERCEKEYKVRKIIKQRFCSFECTKLPIKEISYGTLHSRVKKKWGEQNQCEWCGTLDSKKYEWANLSGEYKFIREDWARLCCKCHRHYDWDGYVSNQYGIWRIKNG